MVFSAIRLIGTLATLAVFGLARSTNADVLALAAGDDKLCNPTGVTFRYTGIRLYQTTLVDWPVRHFWYIVRCNAGKRASQQYYVTNRTSNFSFGQQVCISEEECYILSRVKKYALRNVPVFRPYAEVGTLYRVDRETNATMPLYSLAAENIATKVTIKTSFGSSMNYIPILFSPEVESGPWMSRQTTNPHELYNYTEADTRTIWYITNSIINELNDAFTITNESLIFWEFDALNKELNGLNWRKTLNKAVPAMHPGSNGP